ncbi:hypothetical protein [Vibrio parahaemolyticus]|uniref:hypothetical protein n=1 Tax=Vibrio parahaemolyticus TaxID=670 RepID=UPI0004D4318C|nr:hypothetical protein [Vibrio parahaemolyticus]OQT70252.1 hypothetical protein EM98_025480 [Vibrio parahaemolyticus]
MENTNANIEVQEIKNEAVASFNAEKVVEEISNKRIFKMTYQYSDELKDFIKQLMTDSGMDNYRISHFIDHLIKGEPVVLRSASYLESENESEVIGKRSNTVNRFSQNAGQIKLHAEAIRHSTLNKSVNYKLDTKKIPLSSTAKFLQSALDKEDIEPRLTSTYNNITYADFLIQKIKMCLSIFDREVLNGGVSSEPLSSIEKNGYLKLLHEVEEQYQDKQTYKEKFKRKTSVIITEVDKLEELKNIVSLSKQRYDKNIKMSCLFSRLEESIDALALDDFKPNEVDEAKSLLKMISKGYENHRLNTKDIFEKSNTKEAKWTSVVFYILANAKIMKQTNSAANKNHIEKMNTFLTNINLIVKNCNVICMSEDSNDEQHIAARIEMLKGVSKETIAMISFLKTCVDKKHFK